MIADECELYLEEFVGPQLQPQHVDSDNASELVKALVTLKWRTDTSTPHRSEQTVALNVLFERLKKAHLAR